MTAVSMITTTAITIYFDQLHRAKLSWHVVARLPTREAPVPLCTSGLCAACHALPKSRKGSPLGNLVQEGTSEGRERAGGAGSDERGRTRGNLTRHREVPQLLRADGAFS